MAGILLLGTALAVIWLAVWSMADPSKPSRRWSPFDMRDDAPPPDETRPRWARAEQPGNARKRT